MPEEDVERLEPLVRRIAWLTGVEAPEDYPEWQVVTDYNDDFYRTAADVEAAVEFLTPNPR
jgi:hypothetical protein